MRLTDKGLALIRDFEGLRLTAYRDSAGVLTIGYGHTGRMAPPAVTAGEVITEAEADARLRADAQVAAAAVRRHLTVTLADDEFSALVAFAFNVGEAAFARSSVLRAVNAGDREAVPRRLGLWVKAGGRTLPGLVRRRAAEAELFLSATAATATTAAEPAPGGPVSAQRGKPALASTTNAAAVISAATGTLVSVAGAAQSLSVGFGRWAVPVAIAILIGAAAWIIRERMIKADAEGV